MTKVFLLTAEQFSAAEQRRKDLAASRMDGRQGASLGEVVAAGAMWFVPWYFDPAHPEDGIRRDKALEALAAGDKARSYLSRFYWQD